MAIAFDAVSTGNDAADPTSLTWSHTTTTDSNRVLIVATSTEADTGHTAQTVSGITYGGVALTKVRTDYITGDTDNGSELWYLIAPATGANNVVVTMTSAVDGLFGAAMTFSGVDQTNPIDNHTGTNTANTANPSITVNITTNVDNAMVVNICHATGSATTLTADVNQTQRFNAATTGDFKSAGGTRLATTAGSYTTTWSASPDDDMSLSVASLKPYVAASTVKTLAALGVG